MNVLYEDNHLLAINKPAGIATMGDPGEETIHSWGCDYLRRKYNKPGKVFLGIVSRLDKPTTGALVLARTSKAASRLSKQFAAKSTATNHRSQNDPPAEKVYLAAVQGHVDVDDVWEDYCINDETAKRMRVVSPNHPGAKLARSRVKTIGMTNNRSLLAIHLQTGRKHQIRWQCASRNHPVLGEFKYAERSTCQLRDRGPTMAGPAIVGPKMANSTNANDAAIGIGLHSWILRIEHPTLREEVNLYAPPAENWRSWFPDALDAGDTTRSSAIQIQKDFCLRESSRG